MATKQDYYEILGIKRDAKPEEIKKASKRCRKRTTCFRIRRSAAFTIVLGSTLKTLPMRRREVLVHRAADALPQVLISLVLTGVAERQARAGAAPAAVSETSLLTSLAAAPRAKRNRRGHNPNVATTSRCRFRFRLRKRSRA